MTDVNLELLFGVLVHAALSVGDIDPAFALLLTCGADEDLFLPVIHCPAELRSLVESSFYTGLDTVLGSSK